MQESKETKEATLISHLEALRSVLIKSFIALGIGLVPMFILAPYALDLLSQRIIEESHVTLHYFSPMEVFILQLKLAALFDILLCFPFIAFQIWHFILPALYDKERKFIRSIVCLSSVLFVLGVIFCLIVCFPLIVQFGVSFSSATIQPVFSVSNIVSLAIWLSLSFGCMFQLPLITFSLIKSGIVSYDAVARKRPYVLVGILVIAALLTPPDIISQVILACPTYILFESGLFCARKYRGQKIDEDIEVTPPHVGGFTEKTEEKAENKDIDFSKANSRYQVSSVKNMDNQKPF